METDLLIKTNKEQKTQDAFKKITLILLEVSRSYTTTHKFVGLLWTRDNLVAETSV
jgi:hypothetical protein